MVALVSAFALSHSAPTSAASSTELLRELDRLGSTARVLYVAAHPDDENTRMIAGLTVERSVDVAYLSLTRGSGGQNRIGTEQGDLLGVLRSGELLSAREIDGGRQFFTRARDFGYSKRVEETLATWDEEAVLADIMQVIQSFRPDVVVTRFRETGNTHGHHLASAVLARRAVERLAREEGAWVPKRVVLDIPTWRGDAEDAEFELTIGAFDPVRGLTTGEIAAASRSQHRSQGFGMAPDRDAHVEQLKHVWGDRAETDLLEGIEGGWERLGDDGTVARALQRAKDDFVPTRPWAVLDALIEAQAAMAELPDRPRVRDHREDLGTLIIRAAGLFIRAHVDAEGSSAGATVPVQVEVANRAGRDVRVRAVQVAGRGRHPVDESVEARAPWREKFEVRMLEGPPTATPWLWAARRGAEAGAVAETWAVAPRGPLAMMVDVELTVDGRAVTASVPVRRVWVDRSTGERAARFERLPAATATPVQDVRLMPSGRERAVTYEIRRHDDVDDGPARVRFDVPAGWAVSPAEVDVTEAETTVVVSVRAPAPDAPPFELRPTREANDGREPLLRHDVVDYPHIERTQVLRPSVVRWVPLDLEVPDLRVGYVPGAGDEVAELLAEVGLNVRTLTETEVAEADFAGIDVVLLGVRAFNVHPTLPAARERIFDWVKQGGRLVVQYNTNNWFDALEYDLGPGTLQVGKGRVTDETAHVKRLSKKHPIWRSPHRIGDDAWSGWVQERGLYFAETWDDEWTPLVELADPGEAPQRGALLVKQHGDGDVVFTGLSFFRQLPAGVPGAYRLFINLLAHDRPKR
jgi:LmbE family N-acetylglucosaminyl deacetylase